MTARKDIRRALMIARKPARVAKAEGGEAVSDAMREGFGDEPVGMSDDSVKRMSANGPISAAITRGVISPLATAADATVRGANAGLYGAANIAGQAVDRVREQLPQEWRQYVGHGEQLERDIREMPNAFMGEFPGTPKNAAETAVNIAKKPATAAERGMINLGSPATEPVYYSPLERGISEAKQAKASPEEWKAIASKFPKEETDWRGLHDFLDSQKGSVTRDQVLAHLAGNPVDVREVWKGGDRQAELQTAQKSRGLTVPERDELERLEMGNLSAGRRERGETKFSEHTLPGGTNYREMLLTLPSKADANTAYEKMLSDVAANHGRSGNPTGFGSYATPEEAQKLSALQDKVLAAEDYKSGHWQEPNIVAHVRMNDRTGPNGEKLLHLEEIQSDWHQKGKEGGYDRPDAGKEYAVYADNSRYKDGMTQAQAERYAEQLKETHPGRVTVDETGYPLRGAVPDAPFKDTKDWTALALKRAMRHAADNDYDGITWTTGNQQADRYDLSKHVSEIQFKPHLTPDGSKVSGGPLVVLDKNGDEILNEEYITPERLADTIGKDAAKRVMESPTSKWGSTHILNGDDLRLGGEGMRTYYDSIVPSVAKSLGKQHGAKVGKTQFSVQPDNWVIRRPDGKTLANEYANEESAKIALRQAGNSAPHLGYKIERAPSASETVHHLPITPSMKGKAAKMFQCGGRVQSNPSEAQKHAGNYRKEHTKFHGLDISIENKRGSTRSGKDTNGKAWSCVLPADYGYIKGTEGADGDHVDCYMGPDKNSQTVFIVNQHDLRTDKFDEHKVFLGYNSEREALTDYCKAFSDGKGLDRLGSVETVSMDAFKKWLKSEKTKKPAHSRNIVEHALRLVANTGSKYRPKPP